MLYRCEPTIRRTCREVWRRQKPRGIELEDLYQEGRIAVFETAVPILEARNPLGMVVMTVRRRLRRVLYELVLQCPTLFGRPLLPGRPQDLPPNESYLAEPCNPSPELPNSRSPELLSS